MIQYLAQLVIDHTSTDETITVPVTLVTNMTYDGWGEITATLTNGLDYTVNSSAYTKKVEIVDDDTARHSVSLDAPISVVEGEMIMATLSVSPVLTGGESLIVDLQAVDITGDYLNYTAAPVTITDTNSASFTVPIRTLEHSTKDYHGEIKLEIKRGDGYEKGATFIKNVAVLDKALLPVITISKDNTAPIDEGETAEFMLTANPVPTSEIAVSVNVNHDQGITGNFLDASQIKTHTVPVSITGTGVLRIPTISDAVLEGNGSIVARIEEDPKRADPTQSATYLKAETNDSVSVTITDNDTAGLSSVTISGVESIDEGESAVFTLSAEPIGSNPVAVKVRITQDGDFLVRDISTNTEFDFVIPIDGSTPGQLEISEATVTDNIAEGDGSITLRVLSDPANPDTYSVGAISSYTTTVLDDDDDNLPSITITGGGIVTEGSIAVFSIKATPPTIASSVTQVDVRVEVSEVGNFLTDGAAGMKTVPVNVGTTIQYTQYEVPTSGDEYDEEHGSITATILTDIVNGDGSVDYAVGAVNSANTQVVDDDIQPVMSIGVSSIMEGNDPDNNENMVFTVSLDEESFKEISVTYRTTTTGSATSTNDFLATPGDFLHQSGTLTFTPRKILEAGGVQPGIITQTFNVPIYGDVLDEEHETVVVELSHVQNAALAPSETTETGTISDDDQTYQN